MNRRVVVGAVVVLLSVMLAGCGGTKATSPRVLHWWVAPDRVDTRSLAQTCSTDTYTIVLNQLPSGLDRRRAEIVRHLSAGNGTIDILSLDTSLTAEMDAAGYLARMPAAVEQALSVGTLPKAAEAATVGDRLVVAPWWLDPQLLWFRGSAAERAGLDTTKPISWDDLLGGAERLGTTLQIDDPDGTGLADWVRTLVAAAGGTIMSGEGRTPKIGLATEAGKVAAGVVQFYASANVGPGPSPDARADFAGARGGFLLASSAILTDPVLSSIVGDIHAVPYPQVENKSVAPLSGVSLAVPEDAAEPSLSYEAVSCLTSKDSQQKMMIGSGHGATKTSVYESEEIKGAIASSKVALDAVNSGVNVPATPYWQRVRAALRDTWLPITGVSPSTTPAESQQAVLDLVGGGLR